MNAIQDMGAKIDALKKKLAIERSGCQKALTITGGYEEAKQLLKKARATEEELRAAVDVLKNWKS